MQRIIIGLGLGAGITFGLFILMSYLIKSEFVPPEKSDTPAIQITMVDTDDDIRVRDRRVPKKPPTPKNPPPPQTQRVAQVQKPNPQNMNFQMNNIDVNVQGDTYIGTPGSAGNMSDGDAIPMVVIEPSYPRKAAMEGIEGWVRFKFTVSPDGTPKDIEVIDAEPKRIFERDARKAIYKWKFKPKVVDGKAIEQPNMYYTLEFKLGGE